MSLVLWFVIDDDLWRWIFHIILFSSVGITLFWVLKMHVHENIPFCNSKQAALGAFFGHKKSIRWSRNCKQSPKKHMKLDMTWYDCVASNISSPKKKTKNGQQNKSKMIQHKSNRPAWRPKGCCWAVHPDPGAWEPWWRGWWSSWSRSWQPQYVCLAGIEWLDWCSDCILLYSKMIKHWNVFSEYVSDGQLQPWKSEVWNASPTLAQQLRVIIIFRFHHHFESHMAISVSSSLSFQT